MRNDPPGQPKIAFGRFVQAKRREAGLTQRELAQLLHVTESAVSKWERAQSYPDISLVAALAQALGVSEGELINASEDHRGRAVAIDARRYRRWRGGILWTTGASYAAAVITAFIVNLSVQHTLTWFWIVLAAVATAFTVTTLPLLVTRWRGWITLGAFLLALFALLGINQLFATGEFFAITVVSISFAAVLVFAPIAVATVPLPTGLRRHRTVLALGVSTLALIAFLVTILSLTGAGAAVVPLALPLAAWALTIVWIAALVIRYLPVTGLIRAAVVLLVAAAASWLTDPFVETLIHGGSFEIPPFDFAQWSEPYLQGNIQLTIALSCLAAAALLGALAVVIRATGHRAAANA